MPNAPTMAYIQTMPAMPTITFMPTKSILSTVAIVSATCIPAKLSTGFMITIQYTGTYRYNIIA